MSVSFQPESLCTAIKYAPSKPNMMCAKPRVYAKTHKLRENEVDRREIERESEKVEKRRKSGIGNKPKYHSH